MTTKSTRIEDWKTRLEDLEQAVLEAADEIATSQDRSQCEVLEDELASSTQCGLASASEDAGVRMTEAVKWQKLELMKRVANGVAATGLTGMKSLES